VLRYTRHRPWSNCSSELSQGLASSIDHVLGRAIQEQGRFEVTVTFQDRHDENAPLEISERKDRFRKWGAYFDRVELARGPYVRLYARRQQSNRIPDPTFFAQYEHEPPDMPNSMGLGLSFPVPLWNRNRGNIRAAEAAREQAQAVLDKSRGQAAADIASARLSYDEASQRLKQYRELIGPKSERVRKTVAFAYEKGGSSLLDLLVAERNDNEIRLAAAQAAGDLAIALASLKAATFEISNLSHKK